MSTERAHFAWAYALALGASVSVWFIALRAPLWLDETISYCQIHSGVFQIWSHAGLSFPAYSFILWLFTKFFGINEVALRVPSVVAMVTAVYFLYLTARNLFDPGVALLATVVFCTNPLVIFAAIDARPYAFAVLAITATTHLLVRLRKDDSNWTAAWFGVMAAVIVWFQFLFGVMLPALLVGFLTVKMGGRRAGSRQQPAPATAAIWRQLGVALAGFAVAFLPVIPGVLDMFRTRGDHPYDTAPRLIDLAWTIAPGWFLLIVGGAGFVALIAAGLNLERSGCPKPSQGWRMVLCFSLALIPILILFAVSRETPLHIFVHRYRLVAVPGLALSWALIVGALRPRTLAPLFCVALVSTTSYQYFRSPLSRHHGYTWKYALAVAQQNASRDNAPVVICSDLPESDHTVMPLDSAKESNLFAPLSYYKLTAPVVPLPRSLNAEAIRVASNFLREAVHRHQRFLAMAYRPSYPTLDWLGDQAARNYMTRELGVFDDVRVVEFTPSGT